MRQYTSLSAIFDANITSRFDFPTELYDASHPTTSFTGLISSEMGIYGFMISLTLFFDTYLLSSTTDFTLLLEFCQRIQKGKAIHFDFRYIPRFFLGSAQVLLTSLFLHFAYLCDFGG